MPSIVDIKITAKAGVDAYAARALGLGQEMPFHGGDATAAYGDVKIAGLTHQLALVVVESQRHGHRGLVAIDHHVVVAQGGATVALSAELGELVGDEVDAGGGVEGHATQHTVAVRQEARIGYHNAHAQGLDKKLIIVGSDKLYHAHDGLESDIASDDGGGIALVDCEVDGRHARVGVA